MAPATAPIPEDPLAIARHIKETAYFLRADGVGICELPPYAVYSHKFSFKNMAAGEIPTELDHRYAIAILVDQDERTNQAFSGSDWISNSMSMMSYATSGFIAITLAEYIRRLGYPARAHYAPYYDIVVPPVLLLAGLGEMCRMGDTVLHPFMGPRFKAAVVTTDLPLAPDKPIDFGLQAFCAACKKCARECPSGAISSGGKVMINGYEKWPLDVQKCTTHARGQSARFRMRHLHQGLPLEQTLYPVPPGRELDHAPCGTGPKTGHSGRRPSGLRQTRLPEQVVV
jgi:3-chloro-4-hydroxyphenylacetate reductive dehalogenase